MFRKRQSSDMPGPRNEDNNRNEDLSKPNEDNRHEENSMKKTQ
jgi:hypothetical protein